MPCCTGCQAWTDGDAQAYGTCFTDDCDYVAFDGTHARGREAVIESHDKLFPGVLVGGALVGDVESIRHRCEGVALRHSTGAVSAEHNGRIRPVIIPST